MKNQDMLRSDPVQIRSKKAIWKTRDDGELLPSQGWEYVSSGKIKHNAGGGASTVYAEGFLDEGATYHLDATVVSTAGNVDFQLGDGGSLLNVSGNSIVSIDLVWNQHPDFDHKIAITATDNSDAVIDQLKLTKI